MARLGLPKFGGNVTGYTPVGGKEGAAKKASVDPAALETPLGQTSGTKGADVPPPVHRSSFTQNLFRRFAGPVAAVMLGAAALPAAAGGTLPAETEALDEPVRIEAPATRVAASVQLMPLPVGALGVDHCFENYLQDRLRTIRAQHAQFEAVPPADPVIRTDLLRLHEIVDKVDQLIQQDGALPVNMLADLDRVLDALADAELGQLDATLDQAWRDLPSTDFQAPGLDAVRVTERAPTLEALGRIDGPGDGALRDLLAASPTDFPDQAQDVLTRYSAVMAGADAVVSQLPDFAIVSQAPLAYDSGDGLLFVPPGAQIVKQGDRFAIEAPGMLWQQDGTTVVAADATIQLGNSLDGLTAGRVVASGEDWTAGLDGAVIGVNRQHGYGIIRAQRADLDLEDRTVHLEDAQLVVSGSGEGALSASRLSTSDGRSTLDLASVAIEQTRQGTTATAATANYVSDGTVLQGETLDLRFGPNGARLEAASLQVISGSTQVDLQDAIVDLRPTADGGHRLDFTGERFALADGDNAIQLGAGTRGSLRLGPDGNLTGATLESSHVHLATADGIADWHGAALDVQVGASGHLARVTARGDALAFQGKDFDFGATQGRLDLRFSPEGHLSSVATRADAAQVTTEDGAFDVTGGVLTANLQQGQLRELAAELGTASWRGTDGSRVDAENSRLRVGFHDSGALRNVGLEAGRLDVLTADGQQVHLQDGRGRLDFGADGALRAAEATTGRLVVTDADQIFSVAGSNIRANFDADGHLSAASADLAQVEYARDGGTYFAAGTVALDVTAAQGNLTGVDIAADQIRYADADFGQVTAAHGRLQAGFGEGGHLTSLDFDTRDLSAQGDFGKLDVTGAGHIGATWTPDGAHLSQVTARADQLDFVDADRNLSITDGAVDLTLDEGQLRTATATFAEASYAGDFGSLALTGGTELGLSYDEAGAATLTGFAKHLDLAADGGRLTLDDGRVNGQFGADGALDRLAMSASQLDFTGTGEGDHPLAISLQRPEAVLTALDDGGQRLDITTGAGAFDVDGHHVAMEGLERLELRTTADGQIDGFAADFDGQLDFVQRGGDLAVTTRDLAVGYERDASRLTLDFGEANVALRGEGLQARIEGGHAMLDDHQLFLRVDRAEVLRTLGAQLDVEVEDLTLHVARGEQGNLQALDLQLGGLDAAIGGMDLMVRTPAGERVRLNITADEDGEVIKQAFLQIPEGGEVRIQREDLDVSLGGQTLRFTNGDDGIYRFRGESLDIDAKTADAAVRVLGGNAEVSMDPATGRLVIEEITGTTIDVSTDDLDLHVDIEELRGFMVRMAGLEGGATGAALHLVPTEDGSTLTARATADVGGIPIEVAFDNVHELEALGQISVNQVHVYARDPSGRGDIRIGVGPLEFEGSAIELVGRYHAYDPGRMTESVHQFVTTGGAQLFSGVSFEPDGVLRVGTDREGFNAELAVMLPRNYAMPGYSFGLTSEPSSAPGVIGSLGYRHDDVTFSFFAGALPGSHATLHVKEGTARVGGFEVPERTDIPTTGVAGLRLDLADVDGGQLGLVGGGYVNPAGLVDSPYIEDPTAFGVLGGVEYRKDQWSVGVSGVTDMDRSGDVIGGGVMVRFGVSF